MTRHRKYLLAVLAAVLTLAILRQILDGDADAVVLTVFGLEVFKRLMKDEDEDSQ